jgi:hypothetical protein
MAILFQRRIPVLTAVCLAATLCCLPPLYPAAAADPVDAVVAELDGAAVTASDIALAAALSLFGLHPSAAPIGTDEVQRFLDAKLVDREASRLGIEGSPEEVNAAWEAAAARVGGMAALTTWLDRNGIDAAWARRLVSADLRRQRYIQLRFRAFAFVSEAEVDAALGPGPHTPEERQGARQKLTDEAMQHSLSQWLATARNKAQIRLVRGAIPSPRPFPMPDRAARPAGTVGPAHPSAGGPTPEVARFLESAIARR